MIASPRPVAGQAPTVQARIRTTPEDFIVREQLGFSPDGQGEHVFLHLEKRGLNTADLAQRIAVLSATPLRDIGFSGMKDRHALTRQWFSVGLAGRPEPDWQALSEQGDVAVLEVTRHLKKLRRGVHRANRFILTLRELRGDLQSLMLSLEQVRAQGVPNYFGEQRFGHSGATLLQARQWQVRGGRRLSRNKRSLYLSALRAHIFNTLLAARVTEGSWDRVLPGDVCMLQGTRSQFSCEQPDSEIERRAAEGDIHPALPMWGRGKLMQGAERCAEQADLLAAEQDICSFLEAQGLSLDYRPSRVLADDFCWHFCDDGSLRLEFSLSPGSYATAVLAQIVEYKQGNIGGGEGRE
ncbi:tRNA pseudouridine(13) synthase TruD [Parahaliea sp. F7430]|uniref:tRNA pseudouridine synthase D n=1 Tax=Sediminihaliea albiluteola TaxID=2758564 RepID=A0A7W2YJ35_9GAMM|nr:tRNA pseudouridine(13) synthase TruD [Sediminihaliea albiluteola]MBA6411888.1 tRNA pseudouridine(13) synthase TruD [Sediminihaliea albiluteola]